MDLTLQRIKITVAEYAFVSYLAVGAEIANALATESATGAAASLYANILAVKKGNENSEKILALKEVLLSDTIKNYINSTYGGAVLSVVA